MRSVAKTLFEFWNSFGIRAFPEENIPDLLEAQVVEEPYITYQIIKPNWRNQISTYAKVYYRDVSYSAITNKVDEIESRISEGIMLPTDGGFILLFKDINFCQFTPTGDENLKMAYLSLVLEADSN